MAFPILGSPKPYIPLNSGAPAVGYKLEFRDPTTDVLKATYPTADDADAATNANDNPIILDSRGEVPVGLFGPDNTDYKVSLLTSADVEVWNVADVKTSGLGGVVSSISALKALDTSVNTNVFVSDYGNGVGGGGHYVYKSGSSATLREGIIVAPNSGGGRWELIHNRRITFETCGAVNDGSTNDSPAVNALYAYFGDIGGGTALMQPGSGYNLDDQILIDGGGIKTEGTGKLNNGFIPAYASGPQFVVGNGTTVTYGYTWRDVHFNPGSTGPQHEIFEFRGAQRLFFENCSTQNFYSLMTLGRTGDTAACYWLSLDNCQFDGRNGQPMDDGIVVKNYLGNLFMNMSTVDSNNATPPVGKAGIRINENDQVRVDGIWVEGGSIQRWDYNLHFENARVVNAHFGENVRLDGAATTSVHVRTDAVATAGTSGFEQLNFLGATISSAVSGAKAFDIYNNQSGQGNQSLTIQGCRISHSGGPVIKLHGDGQKITNVVLSDLSFTTEPAAANSDLIELEGEVDNTVIGILSGVTSGSNPNRDVVRLTSFTGTGLQVDAGTISIEGITGNIVPVQSLSGAGAVDIVTYKTEWETTGADAGTLADGWYESQEKLIYMVTDGGDGTLTPSNFGGGTSITFDDQDDWVILEWFNSNWNVKASNGVTVNA